MGGSRKVSRNLTKNPSRQEHKVVKDDKVKALPMEEKKDKENNKYQGLDHNSNKDYSKDEDFNPVALEIPNENRVDEVKPDDVKVNVKDDDYRSQDVLTNNK